MSLIGGWRVGRIGFPITTPSASFVASLRFDLDLGPDEIEQDYDGNIQDLWSGWWEGEGTVEGVLPPPVSETPGVIAYLAPGTYEITIDWTGTLLSGLPIGTEGAHPNIGLWIGGDAGFDGVLVPIGDGPQSAADAPVATATVTVTAPSVWNELHIWTVNKRDDSTIFMPAGITVTIIRL